jgi:hypothetical protein
MVFLYIPLVNIKEFDLFLKKIAHIYFIIDIPKTSCGLDLGIIKEWEKVCCFGKVWVSTIIFGFHMVK